MGLKKEKKKVEKEIKIKKGRKVRVSHLIRIATGPNIVSVDQAQKPFCQR